jgi:isopenicillin-N epimerase
MVSRRHFVSQLARAGVGVGLAPAELIDPRGPAFSRHAIRAVRRAAAVAGDGPDATLASDESYWAEIRKAFELDPRVMYLNSAGCSPTPRRVLEGMIRDLHTSNEAPVQYMWHDLEPRIEGVRRELAIEFGCDPEEIAVTRSASEANQIAILGIDLRPGDEVIVTTHNYDRMLATWDQRAAREGIVVRRVALEMPPRSDEEVVAKFREAVTSQTRVVEFPQLTNWTGQPLPVAAIVSLAQEHGLAVIVDGAQGFAQIPSSRDALGCDYYGTSLHKWLLAPVGTGFLYVRRDQIERLWPLTPAPARLHGNIRKFEEIGTHPAANHNAIIAALAFHRAIGGGRKLARLRYLRDRWVRPLMAESDRVHVRTPLDDPRTGALVLMEIDGLDPVRLHDWLWGRYRIITSPTSFAGLNGLRVSPNVFTSTREVDTLCDAIRSAIKFGVQAAPSVH